MARVSLLSHLFTNQTLIDVFLYFLLNPQEEVYLARIVESTGKALIQVQRTLKRLVEAGLILKATRHKKTYYKADHQHVAYDDMRKLILKAKIFSDPFKNDLEKLKNKVSYGFIYGSVAQGSNTPQSDIDIFLVGDLSYDDAGPFIFHLGRELVQEVNVIIFSPRELEKQLSYKNIFVLNVLQEPKIWLFGDKDEFEKIYQ